jgi:outer membrane protein OmpA-like peptidoglycan-associated protein
MTAGVAMAAACTVFWIGSGPAAAQNAVVVRENPTDCEVAAALGVDKPGCPPLGQAAVRKPATRGLAIGTIDEMPEPPLPPPPEPAAVPKPAAVSKPAVVVSAPAPAPAPRPQPRPEVRPEYRASFQIGFAFGSAQLTENAHQVLDLIGATMAVPGAKTTRFRIVGHTDAVGSDASNQTLSESRANAVKAYLIQQFGIDPARLEALGRGARELLAPGNPTAAENRRVEITNLGG